MVNDKIKWDLDLSGLEELTKELNWLEEHTIEYGFLDEQNIHPEAGVPVAQVAVWNNYGTKTDGGKKWHIPPRPFFDLAELFVEGKLKTEYLKDISKSFLKGKASYSKTLNFMAQDAADQVTFAIDTGKYEALSPETIRKKGHSTVLVDSGYMAESVDGEVKRGS